MKNLKHKVVHHICEHFQKFAEHSVPKYSEIPCSFFMCRVQSCCERHLRLHILQLTPCLSSWCCNKSSLEAHMRGHLSHPNNSSLWNTPHDWLIIPNQWAFRSKGYRESGSGPGTERRLKTFSDTLHMQTGCVWRLQSNTNDTQSELDGRLHNLLRHTRLTVIVSLGEPVGFQGVHV